MSAAGVYRRQGLAGTAPSGGVNFEGRGWTMKKAFLSAVAVATLAASSAFAADLKPILKAPPPVASPWDIAFGGALMSDYNFRGISQSQRGPSVTAYVETRYNVNPNLQLYFGDQYWAVDLPTNPSCECDIYGGIRPTIGALAFDFGFIYYWYPRERGYSNDPKAFFPPFPNGNVTLNQTDYWEVYGKASWDAIKDKLNFGANVYYSPSWLNTGAYGLYASATAKYTGGTFNLNVGLVGEVGWYVSGEFGHYWLGTTDFNTFVYNPPINLPDYNFWNVGLAFTFLKVFTLDLRYYDTDLSKSECNVLTADPRSTPGGSFSGGNNGLKSSLCGASFIATVKADLTYGTNVK
jgi:uncharacterized protein (TIGR02001 family)